MNNRKYSAPYGQVVLIHNILYHNHYYELQMPQYQQLLQLLAQTSTRDPAEIQFNIIEGIYQFHQQHGDNIGVVLAAKQHQHIPFQIRKTMHHILHEYHFLHSIRAYEMLQKINGQASEDPFNNDPNNPFNDEIERVKIHHMYYGNCNPYNMNMLKLENLNFFPQLPEFHDYSKEPQGFRPIRPPQQTLSALQRESQSGWSSEQAKFNPKARISNKKEKEKTTKRISSYLKHKLQKEFGSQNVLSQEEQDLRHCVCRGFVESQAKFYCSCRKVFHDRCMGGMRMCLNCRMQHRDPFFKPLETIVLKYVDCCMGNFTFEEQVNLKLYDNHIKTHPSAHIMVSCAHPAEVGVCWPDGVAFKINGQSVFQIPALLQSHSKLKRKDTGLIITHYIFKENPILPLEKTKVSLEVLPQGQGSLPTRNNRKGSFLLGIYLVETQSIEKLSKELILQNSKISRGNPVERIHANQDISIESELVSCLDPYSRKLIQTPVKGNQCQHSTCFDLETYLLVMENSEDRPWRCPICGKDARKLIKDLYQLQILKEIKEMPNKPNTVKFMRGSLQFVETRRVREGVCSDSYASSQVSKGVNEKQKQWSNKSE